MAFKIVFAISKGFWRTPTSSHSVQQNMRIRNSNMYHETKVLVIIGAMLLPLHLRDFHLHKHHMEKCFCCRLHRYHLSSATRWGRERMERNGQKDGERGCAMQSNWYVNPSLGWTSVQWLNAASDFIANMHISFYWRWFIRLFQYIMFFRQRVDCSDSVAEKLSSCCLPQDSPCY